MSAGFSLSELSLTLQSDIDIMLTQLAITSFNVHVTPKGKSSLMLQIIFQHDELFPATTTTATTSTADSTAAATPSEHLSEFLSSLQVILSHLVSVSEVESIELTSPKSIANYHIHGLTQSNYVPSYSDVTAGRVRDGKEIWKKGIMGQGQIVAVSDTGLEWQHCFFGKKKRKKTNRHTSMDNKQTNKQTNKQKCTSTKHYTHVVCLVLVCCFVANVVSI
jgi:hypothetical protein